MRYPVSNPPDADAVWHHGGRKQRCDYSRGRKSTKAQTYQWIITNIRCRVQQIPVPNEHKDVQKYEDARNYILMFVVILISKLWT